MKTKFSLILLSSQQNLTPFPPPPQEARCPLAFLMSAHSCFHPALMNALSSPFSGSYSPTRSLNFAVILGSVLILHCCLGNAIYFCGFEDQSLDWWISNLCLQPLPLPYNPDTCSDIILVSLLRNTSKFSMSKTCSKHSSHPVQSPQSFPCKINDTITCIDKNIEFIPYAFFIFTSHTIAGWFYLQKYESYHLPNDRHALPTHSSLTGSLSPLPEPEFTIRFSATMIFPKDKFDCVTSLCPRAFHYA